MVPLRSGDKIYLGLRIFALLQHHLSRLETGESSSRVSTSLNDDIVGKHPHRRSRLSEGKFLDGGSRLTFVSLFQLADFGFAKRIQQRTYTLCGTPDYFSPEIIQSKGSITRCFTPSPSYRASVSGHGKPTDWWTLGARQPR